MRNLILFAYILLSVSCKETSNGELVQKTDLKEKVIVSIYDEKDTVKIHNENEKIKLQILNEEYYPDGCGGVFSNSRNELDKTQFVFTHNTKHCFLKIKNIVVKANYVNDIANYKCFENDDYYIKLKLNISKKYDEGGLYNCELNIFIKKDKVEYNYILIGEDGC
jgi:hypothetical protein